MRNLIGIIETSESFQDADLIILYGSRFHFNYGWPAKEVIGEQGNLTICNVIQHSDNTIRLHYLPPRMILDSHRGRVSGPVCVQGCTHLIHLAK